MSSCSLAHVHGRLRRIIRSSMNWLASDISNTMPPSAVFGLFFLRGPTEYVSPSIILRRGGYKSRSGLHGLLQELLNFVYIDDVPTSQETHQWVTTACYGHSFIFIYVFDVRTWQETHLWFSTACYGDSFYFFICRWCSYLTGNNPMERHGLLRR
jgi:hypothetical protein